MTWGENVRQASSAWNYRSIFQQRGLLAFVKGCKPRARPWIDLERHITATLFEQKFNFFGPCISLVIYVGEHARMQKVASGFFASLGLLWHRLVPKPEG